MICGGNSMAQSPNMIRNAVAAATAIIMGRHHQFKMKDLIVIVIASLDAEAAIVLATAMIEYFLLFSR